MTPAIRAALAAALAILAAPAATAQDVVAPAGMLDHCERMAEERWGAGTAAMDGIEELTGGARVARGTIGAALPFRCRYSPRGVFRWLRTDEELKDARADREPSDRQLRACGRQAPGAGEVESAEPIGPGAWAIVMRFPDGRRLCEVDGEGRVAAFERVE